VYPSTIKSSAFPKVQDKLLSVGVKFDPWQQGFGTIALGVDGPDCTGKWASTIGGVVASIPRQVGKTFTIGHLLIGLCLLFPGLRAIWTSHHLRTTGNTFRSMQGMVRKKKVWPHIESVRLVNGEQEILFKNGSVIMFGARALGFGRGMDKIDIEVFDEALILPLRALEDMVPATNQAQNPHGGLLFFIGTPPRPTDEGESFTAKRQQALDGNADDDMVYVEFSADPDADPNDRSQWPIMNPSYPSRTPLESMLRMRKNMPDEDAWRREAMGVWDAEASMDVVSATRWEQLKAIGPEPEAPPSSFGVAAHDGQFSVVACWAGGDARFLEEVFAHIRLDSVSDWITARAPRRAPVLVPNYGAAAPLLPILQAKRVDARLAPASETARGCELLVAGCDEGWLTHADQESLKDSLAGAKKKLGRNGAGWTFDLKNSVRNAPSMALALALAGAAGRREPGPRRVRKAVIG